MDRRTRMTLTVGVTIMALLLMGAGFPSQKVPPKEWATGVCTTVNDWVSSAQTGAAELDLRLDAEATTLRDVRDALVDYLGETAAATTLAIDSMDAAGTPATPKGAKAADTLMDSFRKIRTSLRKLQNQAEDVSIRREAKALKQVKALQRQVDEEFESFQGALARLRKLDPNHKLRRAFRADATCQAL